MMLNGFTESTSHVPPLRLSRLDIDEDSGNKGAPFRCGGLSTSASCLSQRRNAIAFAAALQS